jgi:hypothetical protein
VFDLGIIPPGIGIIGAWDESNLERIDLQVQLRFC